MLGLAMKFCPMCKNDLIDRIEGGRQRKCCPDMSCGYIFWDNPVPVVAAIVEHNNNEIILIQNRGWPSTWYGLVSGFLERGEAPEDAILREIKEELGLEGKIVSLIGTYSFEKMHQIIIAFHVRAFGDIALDQELKDYRRVSVESLKPWAEGTGPAVSDWLSRRARTTVE
jgi:NAD+ diphosphatase